MRFRSVVARWSLVFVPVAAALACSDDSEPGPGVKCGPGTVLEDGQCVPAGGAGGSASGGSNGTAGKSPTAGTVGDGGTGEPTPTDGGTSSGGVGGSTNAGNAGADDGGGGEGGAGPDPEDSLSRWYVFRHQKGVFAYDTTKFPATEGLLTLSALAQGSYYYGVAWSPDGRTVLYLDQGSLYAADMTGDEPSNIRVLASNPTQPAHSPKPMPPWAWSADSASVALLSQRTLSVIDPSQAAPTLHPLTTTLLEYYWAPSGDRLLYIDDAGTHVVQVTQGTPGTPITLDDSADIWSPSGEQLVGQKGWDVALTTLSANSATLELLTDLEPESGTGGGGAGGAGGEGGGGPYVPPVVPDSIYSMLFNKDGSKLTFGFLEEGLSATYLVDLDPTPGPLQRVVADEPDGAGVGCYQFSPDGSRLLCQWGVLNGGAAWVAVDPNGGDPITVLEVATYNDWVWSPNPANHQLFTHHDNKVIMVDLATPNTAVQLASGMPSYSVSPRGDLLSYVVKPKIFVVDLAAPQESPAEIATDQFAYLPPVATWSPDGRFISVTDDSHQQRLVRVDGAELSTPVALQSTSTGVIYGAWQP